MKPPTLTDDDLARLSDSPDPAVSMLARELLVERRADAGYVVHSPYRALAERE